MSQFANNHQKFWAIHRRCQNEDLDIPRTVKQLLTYPQVVQQMIITHLIFLYNHYSPEDQNRYYYAAEIPVMSENESERCMFNLRQVVHALVHNDPHPEKHYKVKLNPWQQHLLHHFETLAPFPTWMTAEEDLFALMWGEEWHGLWWQCWYVGNNDGKFFGQVIHKEIRLECRLSLVRLRFT
jgi:hypothetical protein